MSLREELLQKAHEVILEFERAVIPMGIGPRIWPDHIGYRCASSEEFLELREALEWNSVYFHQSIVSLRRIVVAELSTPFDTSLGPLRFLELADQKPDGSQKSGFDHIEVVPVGADTPEDVVRVLQNARVEVSKASRPHHPTYDFRLPSGFKISIEEESLVRTIARREMGLHS